MKDRMQMSQAADCHEIQDNKQVKPIYPLKSHQWKEHKVSNKTNQKSIAL